MKRDSIILTTKGFSVVERKENSGKKWHYVQRKNGVAILAINQKEEIILVRQRRPIINKILLEIPAGGVESNISLTREAKRELQEETGFYARTIKKLVDIYPSPGYYTEKTFIFLATDLIEKKRYLTEAEKKNKLTIVVKSLPQILKSIDKGEITDAKTIVAVLFYLKQKRLLRNNPQSLLKVEILK